MKITESELKDLIRESIEEVMAANQGAVASNPQKTQGMPIGDQFKRMGELYKTVTNAVREANALGLTDAATHLGMALPIISAEYAKIKIRLGKSKVRGWLGL